MMIFAPVVSLAKPRSTTGYILSSLRLESDIRLLHDSCYQSLPSPMSVLGFKQGSRMLPLLSQPPAEGLVEEGFFQLGERVELALVKAGELARLGGEGVELGDDALLNFQRRQT